MVVVSVFCTYMAFFFPDMVGSIIVIAHSFLQATEFWAEPRNLPFSVEFWYCRRILLNFAEFYWILQNFEKWLMISKIAPPWSATCHCGRALHRWLERFLISGGEELSKSWPNSCRQIATRHQCSCAGFGFTADYGFMAIYLRLHSRLRLYSHYL